MKTFKQYLEEKSPAWQRSAGKDPEGGLNRKGIASYRRENPGSKLSMAVTTKPSKLKPGSKAANRRKSFCARMGGMKKRLTSAKKLLTSLPSVYRQCAVTYTHFWESYKTIVPSKRHREVQPRTWSN